MFLSFQENLPNLEGQLESLRLKCVAHLKGEGFDDSSIRTENYLHMRYHGTDCALVSLLMEVLNFKSNYFSNEVIALRLIVILFVQTIFVTHEPDQYFSGYAFVYDWMFVHIKIFLLFGSFRRPKNLSFSKNICLRTVKIYWKLQIFLRLKRYDDLHFSFQMCTTSPEFPTFLESFLQRYQAEFGFVLQNRDVLVDDVRVRGIGKTEFQNESESEFATDEVPVPVETSDVFFDDRFLPTAIFKMENLLPGNRFSEV